MIRSKTDSGPRKRGTDRHRWTLEPDHSGGNLRIRDNPSLCTPLVNAFIAVLSEGLFGDSLDISGIDNDL